MFFKNETFYVIFFNQKMYNYKNESEKTLVLVVLVRRLDVL